MTDSNPKFSTARTRELRSTDLKPEDERTVSHIENFGCSVVHIKPTKNDFGWSYTIGVFDTCGQPELIAVGLPEKTAHFLLNEAVNLLRKGIDLTTGRYPDLIENVDCEFRPVDPKWINHVMNWDIWYYRHDIPPALQAVYPDKANRFPEDDDFDENYRVPLLQSAGKMQTIEDDFWASNDPQKQPLQLALPRSTSHRRLSLASCSRRGRIRHLRFTRSRRRLAVPRRQHVRRTPARYLLLPSSNRRRPHTQGTSRPPDWLVRRTPISERSLDPTAAPARRR